MIKPNLCETDMKELKKLSRDVKVVKIELLKPGISSEYLRM